MKSIKEFENKIICGDCLEVMKEIPDNSVDLLATDPPYQLSPTGKGVTYQFKYTGSGKFCKGREEIRQGFMGKEWDVLPSVEIWKECLRVLKPGAFAFIMTTPRQDSLCQILMDLSQAGFQMGFSSIYWTYASGFPKASNISKMVDKRGGKDLSWFVDYILKVAKERGITKKELTMLFPSKNNKLTGWLWNKQHTQEITLKQYNKIKDFLDLPFETIKEAKREIVGKHKSGIGKAFNDGQWRSESQDVDDTIPSTDQAKALEGSYGGFQPKPSVEIILVCMKKLSEKTYVEQALKDKKGITWLDDGRIPYKNEIPNMGGRKKCKMGGDQPYGFKIEGRPDEPNYHGRFPANLLVSDDVLNNGKNISYGKSKEPYSYKGKKYKVEGFIGDNSPNAPSNYGDSGSYSRYFDLDNWWKDKISKLPREVQRTFPFLIVPKASKSEKNKGLDDKFEKEIGHNRFDTCERCGGYILQNQDRPSACKCEKPIRKHNKIKGNYHPTCKPIQLMSYLVTIGSREGDIVLDPFIGSGTTACSCVILNRHYIGIEQSKEYYEIAKARIKAMIKTKERYW